MSEKVKNSLGFTLIEITIVMSIIALVFFSAITFAQSLSNRSDDAKRESDLRNIQSALQQYYNDQGYYPCTSGTNCPSPLNLTTSGSIDSCYGTPVDRTSCTNKKVYLGIIPKDPKHTSDPSKIYTYTAYKDKNSMGDCDNLGYVPDDPDSSKRDPINACRYYQVSVLESNGSTFIVESNGHSYFSAH